MAGNLRAEDNPPPALDGSGMRIGVVCGRFNDVITLRLLDGVRRGLSSMGVAPADVVVEWVPGSFEIPFAAKLLAESERFHAVICLGAVIRGETSHYDFVAGECARGITEVQLSTGVPVMFGVLTTENDAQAFERSEDAGGHNVGEDCAHVAVEMATLVRRYE
jgi:6,7-dimethyl-8-ribityllumazine synthase